MGPQMPRHPSPTTLYRYFDADGRLLYVGISGDGFLRAEQHARLSGWWHMSTAATLQHFASREEALDAEFAAIRAELPLHNRRHHPGLDRSRPAATTRGRGRPDRTSAWVGEALRLRRRGLSIAAIAERLAIPSRTVADTLRRDRDLRRARLASAWRDLVGTIHRAGWPHFEIEE